MTEKKNDKKKILIVDDELDVTLALKMYLEQQGYQVDTFTQPVKALSQFKAAFYDLLILDIKMPDMNGFELYREIKKKDDAVKVFFLTALSEMHDYDAYKKEVSPKEGERYFIAKPIENEEILRRINTMIRYSPPENDKERIKLNQHDSL
ncbi:MAG: response regulator transcription factor [Thermoproteota archaeon]|nr:response regulator transcription factor [Thermoproteota archaeon]